MWSRRPSSPRTPIPSLLAMAPLAMAPLVTAAARLRLTLARHRWIRWLVVAGAAALTALFVNGRVAEIDEALSAKEKEIMQV